MSCFDENPDSMPSYEGELLEAQPEDGESYEDADLDTAFTTDARMPRRGAAAGGNLTSSGEPGENEKPVGRPVFDRLDDWVSRWLIPVYARNLDAPNLTWCPKWWLHPEAYVRLDALWRAWEHHRYQPGTGMSVYMRDYLDQHMAVLTAQSGPFNGCKPEKHGEHLARPLPAQPMPTDAEIERAYMQALRALEVEKLKGRHGEIPA